jgi:hypothetical protein
MAAFDLANFGRGRFAPDHYKVRSFRLVIRFFFLINARNGLVGQSVFNLKVLDPFS